MSLSDRQWLFLQDVAKLIQKAEELGIKLTGGELYRTVYQQRKHLADGKSKTMKSKHLSRLAIDLNFFIDKKLIYGYHPLIQELGDYWESLRETNQWGGNWTSFKDYPHFQG